MKKRVKTRKLSRTANERKQLFRNLIASLVQHGFIETSEAKAKAVKPIAERLVTIGKIDSLVSVRRLMSETGKVDIARGLMEYGHLFAKRPGGYLRLIRLNTQTGDNTQVVRMEWVEKLLKPEVVAPVKPVKLAKTEVVTSQKEIAAPVKEAVKSPKKVVKKVAKKTK